MMIKLLGEQHYHKTVAVVLLLVLGPLLVSCQTGAEPSASEQGGSKTAVLATGR